MKKKRKPRGTGGLLGTGEPEGWDRFERRDHAKCRKEAEGDPDYAGESLRARHRQTVKPPPSLG